jgi:hypothetical protein
MVYAGELLGAGAPVRFIYVWPSRDLIARSWSWPASWHDAFQDAASRIGLAVAVYALDGGRITKRLISLQLAVGSVKFRVKSRGGSLYITVVAFTGPDHSPDFPDGTRQPSAVEGLILGLHGSGEGAYLVVFHGHMPFIPAGVYRREQSPQIWAFGREQGNSVGNNKIIIGYRIGDLLRGASARDMIAKDPSLVDGKSERGCRAPASKPGAATLAKPGCDWTKSMTLASLEMKNGCLTHLRAARVNSQPILVLFNRARGKNASLVSRLLDEKHLYGHVLSKRIH